MNKRQIKQVTQKKPQPPALKAQIKLHKPSNPIRPVIISTAPTYKVAKHLIETLNRQLHQSNQYNFINSITLAHNLTKLKINENHKKITFDIKDLYVSG